MKDLIERAEKALLYGKMEELHDNYRAVPCKVVEELVQALKEAENLAKRYRQERPYFDAAEKKFLDMEAERDRLAVENEKLWAVADAVQSSLDGSHDWLETYCDVGAPDDCDHCVIVGAISDLPERKP